MDLSSIVESSSRSNSDTASIRTYSDQHAQYFVDYAVVAAFTSISLVELDFSFAVWSTSLPKTKKEFFWKRIKVISSVFQVVG